MQTITDTQTAVNQAAHNFAAALAETPQFLAFEQAAAALQQDAQARQLIGEYQQKQQSLYMMTMLGAVSPEEQAEMARLQQALNANTTVAAYTQCQSALVALCQESGRRLSERIGYRRHRIRAAKRIDDGAGRRASPANQRRSDAG